MKRSAGEEEGNEAHVFLVCIMHTTGVLPGGGGGGGRGASSRVAAALDEDAQKRASREILERHAPQERCGGAALRVPCMVSSIRRSIRHACIHRDHSSIDSFIVIILFYISYQVIMMLIIVYHHHYHCYLFFCFRQPRATTFQWCFLLLLLYLYGNDDGLGSFKQVK